MKLCFYFPEKEAYEGRFFQYLSPAPEDERESEKGTGEDDRITFALTHGAYYVVSNQGGFVQPLAERCYKANAQSAMLSRKYAQKVYGYEHRLLPQSLNSKPLFKKIKYRMGHEDDRSGVFMARFCCKSPAVHSCLHESVLAGRS